MLVSFLMGSGPCRLPNSSNVNIMGHAVLPLLWMATTSASVAEDVALLMVNNSVCIGPLSHGVGFVDNEEGLSERK